MIFIPDINIVFSTIPRCGTHSLAYLAKRFCEKNKYKNHVVLYHYPTKVANAYKDDFIEIIILRDPVSWYRSFFERFNFMYMLDFYEFLDVAIFGSASENEKLIFKNPDINQKIKIFLLNAFLTDTKFYTLYNFYFTALTIRKSPIYVNLETLDEFNKINFGKTVNINSIKYRIISTIKNDYKHIIQEKDSWYYEIKFWSSKNGKIF